MNNIWLANALSGTFSKARVRAYSASPIGEGYGLSSRLFRLSLDGEHVPPSVVIKLWDIDGPAGDREVRFYDTFGSDPGIRTARYYYGDIDTSTRRGAILMEDLGDVIQCDCLDPLPLDDALHLTRVIAQFHAHWWTRSELPAATWLPDFTARRRGADWYTSRRALFVEKYADRIGEWHLKLLASGELLEERSNARLAAAPETLLHADLHLDNVLLRANDRTPYVIDWARAARGPGILDLTQMVFGNTTLNRAEEIISMYHDALNASGIHMESDTLRYHLGGAVLRYFITWTCGVARWEPASERDRLMIDDGIARAIRMIEYLRDHEPELLKL